MKAPSENFVLAFVFVSSYIVRAAFVLMLNYGIFNAALVGGDSKLYFEIAENLINGNGFAANGHATAFVSPLFPWFISGSISIFGKNPLAITLLQQIFSALACVYIAKSAGLLFQSKRIELIAGLLAAFNLELILWGSIQLITEPLYICFLAAAIMTLIAAIKTDSALQFALSGALFALASLTRPISIALWFGVLIFLIFRSAILKTQILRISWFFVLFILVMLPWGIRNHFVMGKFTFSSLESGHVFWLGNNSQYDRYDHKDMVEFGGYTAMIMPDKAMLQALANKSEAESNDYFFQKATDHILENPKAFLIRAGNKNWNMWRPTFSNSSFRNKLFSYTVYPVMLLLSLFGMALAFVNSGKSFLERITSPAFVLIIILLGNVLIHSTVTGEIRFRVPLWVILIPFAAFALNWCFNSFAPVRKFLTPIVQQLRL
ncbi:MAG: glycosyltransferase family 39 protein [Pyrinomonadaceae bacterium]